MDTKPLVVGDVMSLDPIVVRVDAPLEEADLVLRSTFMTGLPVVDANGKLVGIISHAHLVVHQFGPSVPDTAGSAPTH